MLLRLAVLNVQSGINVRRGYWQYLTRGWKYLLPHTAGALKKAGVFLRDEKTDIALCTEVEERALRSVFLSHARVMRTHARLDHGRFFPTRTHFPFVREGNAILTRYDIVSHTLHRLPGVRTPRVLGGNGALGRGPAHRRIRRASRTLRLVSHPAAGAHSRDTQGYASAYHPRRGFQRAQPRRLQDICRCRSRASVLRA